MTLQIGFFVFDQFQILDAAGPIAVFEIGAAHARDAYRLLASGSTLIDDSEDAMSWRIGDRGFEMTLSARVPELIGQHLRPWLEAWLGPASLYLVFAGLALLLLGVIFRHSLSGFWARHGSKRGP